MARIDNHDAFIRKNEESRIVVIVWLEPAADEHFARSLGLPIDLSSLDAAMIVDIANVSSFS